MHQCVVENFTGFCLWFLEVTSKQLEFCQKIGVSLLFMMHPLRPHLKVYANEELMVFMTSYVNEMSQEGPQRPTSWLDLGALSLKTDISLTSEEMDGAGDWVTNSTAMIQPTLPT